MQLQPPAIRRVLPKRPNYCSARHCRAAPAGTAAAPELPLLLPGPEPSLGRKSRSGTEEQLVLCFTGLPRKAWEWQEAVGSWGTLTEGPRSLSERVVPKSRGCGQWQPGLQPPGPLLFSLPSAGIHSQMLLHLFFFTLSKRTDNKITKPKCSVFFPITFVLDRGAVLEGANRMQSRGGQ